MTYNGHRNYNAWNVSLWISNDEGWYRTARDIVRRSATLDEAAMRLCDELPKATPDGVPLTRTNVRLALRDFR